MHTSKSSVRDFLHPLGLAIALFLSSSISAAFAAPNFSATGNGTVNVTDADLGDDLKAQFTYDLRGRAGFSTQTWTFLATATSTGPVTINYQWRGFHSFFRVRTFLRTVDGGGVTTIISQGPVNCCTSPSAGFNYVGQVTLNTVAGQPFGFTLGGSHFDGTLRLSGTLTIMRPDDDGDGVNNDDDLCPDTAPGDSVDANGCSDAQVDEDGDGVCDPGAASNGPSMCIGEDACAGTAIPEEVPTVKLLVNRWALVDGDFNFDTVAPKGEGTGRSFTTADTAGCSCGQIISACGYGMGHTRNGCSNSVMDSWTGLFDQAGQPPLQCHED